MAPTLAGVDEPGAAVHGFLAELRRAGVAVPVGSKLTVVAIAPTPAAAAHEDPAEAAHVQLPDVAPTGSESLTDAPVTADGPSLVTTIV